MPEHRRPLGVRGKCTLRGGRRIAERVVQPTRAQPSTMLRGRQRHRRGPLVEHAHHARDVRLALRRHLGPGRQPDQRRHRRLRPRTGHGAAVGMTCISRRAIHSHQSSRNPSTRLSMRRVVPDAGGHGNERPFVGRLGRRQLVGIDDADIVRPYRRLRRQDGRRDGLQGRAAPLARRKRRPRGPQRARKHQRLAPLLGREDTHCGWRARARRPRAPSAPRAPRRGTSKSRTMRRISAPAALLLAEDGDVGLHQIEQLQHHRQHAREMPGPDGALPALRRRPGLHARPAPAGYIVLDLGAKRGPRRGPRAARDRAPGRADSARDPRCGPNCSGLTKMLTTTKPPRRGAPIDSAGAPRAARPSSARSAMRRPGRALGGDPARAAARRGEVRIDCTTDATRRGHGSHAPARESAARARRRRKRRRRSAPTVASSA